MHAPLKKLKASELRNLWVLFVILFFCMLLDAFK